MRASRLLGALVAALALSAHIAVAGGAPGSWVGVAPPLQVASHARHVCSQPLLPPALASGQHLLRVRWRFDLPAGGRVQAQLCHPLRCTALAAARGSTQALAGLEADQPLQLCFRLERDAKPVRVGGLQVLVDYRP